MNSVDTFHMIVAGSFAAGKTSFIEQLSEIGVVSLERVIDESPVTLAFDFGRLTVDETLQLYFLGTPGARRFTLRNYSGMELKPTRSGFVLVIDTRQPESMTEARTLLTEMRTTNLAYLIALNRHDAADACSQQEIRKLLGLQPSEMVVKCNANARAEVRDTVLVLLALMSDDASAQKLRAKLRATAVE